MEEDADRQGATGGERPDGAGRPVTTAGHGAPSPGAAPQADAPEGKASPPAPAASAWLSAAAAGAGSAPPEDAGSAPPETGWRNFYGRRLGKTIRPSQRGYLAEDLAALRPAGVAPAENPGRAPVDLGAYFGDDRPVWLEIGFGGGEHMVHMAARHPEVGIVGCEPFINGVAMLLGKIRAAGVGNVAVYPGDARDLLDVLPPGSLARAFLLYPDPWPKRRHRRRRFVTPDHLRPLARAMRPGAALRIATDIPDYMDHALEEVPRAGFTLASHGPAPWDDWPGTRYEAKALREGRAPDYATFLRGGA